MFQIREYSDEYNEQVTDLIMNLEKFYPTIRGWWVKELPKLLKKENGEHCLIVLLDGVVEGVAISGIEKSAFSTVKIKTFYLAPTLQHMGIGPFLLEKVIDHWVDQKIQKFFVTFAEEEVEELLEYFRSFGFELEGVIPLNYRENTAEYYMSKLQVYGNLEPRGLKEFSKNFLFRLRGYETVKEGNDFIIVKKLISLKEPYKIFVKFLTNHEPNVSILEEVAKEANDEDCLGRVIISFYALDYSEEAERRKIEILDGYDLESMFYPLKIQRDYFCGLIHAVKPEYGSRIFFDGQQVTFGAPSKKELRRDNIFFRSPTAYQELQRGSVCVLYESEPTCAVIGEAQIKEIHVDTPENLYKIYGKKAVLSLEEIKKMYPSGLVLGIEYGTRRKYKKHIPLKEVKKIINYNPVGAQYLNKEELTEFRRLGGIQE